METRRAFIRKSTALGVCSLLPGWVASSRAADSVGPLLPRRRLFRDGTKTTAFGVGGWHVGMADDPADAERILERAMERGVRFYDNARVYGQGRSETYYGRFLVPKYRDQVVLMTKSYSHTRAAALKDLDLSLAALKTDRIDLWQMHSLETPDDVQVRFNGGVVDAFLEAKEQGKTRCIGFTGHANFRAHARFLELLAERGLEFDACQMPLNVCDANYESFQKGVLPTLLERGYGVLAMKTFAGGSVMGRRFETTPEELKDEDIPDVVNEAGISLAQMHQYVYSLPVSVLISGCKTVDELEQNVAVLQDLKTLSTEERDALAGRARPFSGYNVENYKRLLG